MCFRDNESIGVAKRVKNFYHTYGIGHLILLSCYFSFILLTAAVFYAVESPTSANITELWQQTTSSRRLQFIKDGLLPQIFNNSRLLVFIHEDKSRYLANLLNQKLNEYENSLKIRTVLPRLPCTYANSIIFVFSTITTIGHGYIYPVTKAGRCVSIISSVIGIPITIIVIKDLAFLMGKLFNYPCILFLYAWQAFRYCTLKSVDENELLCKMHGNNATELRDYRIHGTERLLNIPVMIAVLALVGWTTLGCVIALTFLPSADAFTSFYFIFNSLTTTGISNVNPGESSASILLLFGYLLIGFAAVSLFINLLHTKFSKAYWLPGKYFMPVSHELRIETPDKNETKSMNSYEEDDMSDLALNHYVTLGVLQSEDKCPLIGVLRKEKAFKNESTQTSNFGNIQANNRNLSSPEALFIHQTETSECNVNNLMRETYSRRPPRLIM